MSQFHYTHHQIALFFRELISHNVFCPRAGFLQNLMFFKELPDILFSPSRKNTILKQDDDRNVDVSRNVLVMN